MCRARLGRRFWAALRHAFAIPAERPLTDQQREWLDRLARKVLERRLVAPALLLLESVRPISYIGSQAVAFFKPVISAAFAPELCDEVVRLLENRAAVGALVEMIERYEAEARAADTSRGGMR